ncbi:SH3 domain-containing protein [soil metagenome]
MVAARPKRSRRFAIFVLCVVAVVFAPLAQITPRTALADTNLTVGGEARVSYTGGDAIRVRSTPSYAGSVVTSVPEGWLVTVLEGPVDDGAGSSWYKVTARAQTGYIVSDYLANPDSSGTGSQVSAAAAATTTTALNLRSAASLTASVLLVMPSGASVQTTGSAQNGYTQLTYQGTTGWAASQFLTSGSAPAPTPGSVISNAWVTGGSLNLRSGSSTSTGVLLVMSNGAQVGVTGSAVNGFTPVRYNSVDGWAFSTYLTSTQPGSNPGTVVETRYTSANLNMRSGAGTSFSVLIVIPSGAAVGITGSQTNGFFPVRYNNTNGFASANFLTTTAPGSGTAPTPTPPPSSGTIISTLYTTAGLNLRSGAGTSFPVLLVIPSGAQVGVTGAQSNGFYPVRYNSTDGFASSQFLTSTVPGSGSTPTPTPSPGSGNTGGGGIVWPVTGGTWEITQGYNGSSHINTGSTYQYYYSLDLARQDRSTAGRSVYSPVNGTIRWFDRASGGIAIDMGNGFAVAMFHVTVDRSLVAGSSISQGDYIGFVSGPGQEGFVQFAHLHITVWATTDGGNWSRQAVPFSGQNSISGNSYPEIGGTQQWTRTLFYP